MRATHANLQRTGAHRSLLSHERNRPGSTTRGETEVHRNERGKDQTNDLGSRGASDDNRLASVVLVEWITDLLDLITIGIPMLGNIYGKRSESSKQAGKNRRFNKKVLTMGHQWEVADLIAAGLNPILSAGGSPSGGAGGAAGANSAQELAAIAGAAETVGGGVRRGATFKSEVASAREAAKKAKEDTKTAGYDANVRKTEQDTAQHQRDVAKAQVDLVRQQQSTARGLEAKYAEETRLLNKKQPGGSVGELIDTKVFEFLESGAKKPGQKSPVNKFKTIKPGMMHRPGFQGDPQKFIELYPRE